MTYEASVRNVAQVLWTELPGHHGGALSKLLVHPDVTGSQHLDYRISCYAPGARVEVHAHSVQEQIYHVLEGEGLLEVDHRRQVVRRHDVAFLPPGTAHAIHNTGTGNLVFVVVTSPIRDAPKTKSRSRPRSA